MSIGVTWKLRVDILMFLRAAGAWSYTKSYRILDVQRYLKDLELLGFMDKKWTAEHLGDYIYRGSTLQANSVFVPMIGENRQLVTNELVEFEKLPVEVLDCRKITNHFKGIYRIYLNLITENQRMTTCNRLNLQT